MTAEGREGKIAAVLPPLTFLWSIFRGGAGWKKTNHQTNDKPRRAGFTTMLHGNLSHRGK
jgi:hypothetical protein